MPRLAIVSHQPGVSAAAATSLAQALTDAGHVVARRDGDVLEVGAPSGDAVNVVFALPATAAALESLAQLGDAAQRPEGAWLGLLVIDAGEAALTGNVARELGREVLGTTPAAWAASVATKLGLIAQPRAAQVTSPEFPAPRAPLPWGEPPAAVPERRFGSLAVVVPWVLVVVLALLHVVRG